ncbi:MAG: hypothetical protein GVY18_15850 [Bacteroidetes bacterium]|nr:hypothetical protein [Bacteroidota bacterium]
MLDALYMVLSAAAYSAFYAGAPGRQSQAVGPSRVLLGAGIVLTVAALALSVVATRSTVGPVLTLTVMMTVASVLAITGPFMLPDSEGTTRRRRSRAGASADGTDARSVSSRPAPRPPNLLPSDR